MNLGSQRIIKIGFVAREPLHCLAAQPKGAAIFEGEPYKVPSAVSAESCTSDEKYTRHPFGNPFWNYSVSSACTAACRMSEGGPVDNRASSVGTNAPPIFSNSICAFISV